MSGVLDRIVVTTQENISFAQRGLTGSQRA
jgi:hypothetical protein